MEVNTLAYFCRSLSTKEKKFLGIVTSGLYYKHIMIQNDDSSIVNKLQVVSLTDDTRVIIYDRNMFIIEGTSYYNKNFSVPPILWQNKLACFSLKNF